MSQDIYSVCRFDLAHTCQASDACSELLQERLDSILKCCNVVVGTSKIRVNRSGGIHDLLHSNQGFTCTATVLVC